MLDFNDLARSGTAPEASKSKTSQINSSSMAARPKTRSTENDMQDFNMDLRTNRLSSQKADYGNDDPFIFDDMDEEANEAMQAYFEDMIIARQELDLSTPNSAGGGRISAAGRRSSKESKKPPSSHYAALSAYTQNVPQIILQTSKKGSKTATSSPRAVREPKADVRADIRAVYGVDVLERAAASAQRPRSQKPSNSTSSGQPRTLDDVTVTNNARDTEQGFAQSSPPNDGDVYATSNTSTGRSSSASRLRANVSGQSSNNNGVANGNSPTGAAGMVGMKPFSVRKAAPSTSSGPRQATVPRPFSHTDGVRTSVSQGSSNRASLDTPTSSSSSKRVAKKSAGSSGPSPLLKSSLAPSSYRSGVKASESTRSESSRGSGDLNSDRDGSEGALPADHPNYLDVQEYADEIPTSREDSGVSEGRYQQKSTAPPGRGPAERASSHSAKVTSTRKPQETQSPPLYGGHSTGALKKSPPDNMRDSPTNPSYKTQSKETHSGRGYSRSPTMNMDGSNMNKYDSEGVFLDIIQDADGMECSFDDSPILAAYVQQQESRNAQFVVNVEDRKDPNSRPQSRKLYLGAEKDSSSTSPSGAKSYKTAPRSAGARYSVPDSPHESRSDHLDPSQVPLRKMSSFNELIPQTRKWNEINHLPDMRPPSRQSSAFPVHLADEPGTARHAESNSGVSNSKTAKASITNAPARALPPGVSSMRWEKGDQDEEYVEEEDLPLDEAHNDCDVESSPPSEDEASHLDEAVYHSTSNASGTTTASNVITSNSSVNVAPYHVGAYIIPVTAPVPVVTPAKEHISIIRSPLEEDTDSVNGSMYSSYTSQRPPSRQKIAAQHLFEGMPPPSRLGSEKETRGKTAPVYEPVQSDMPPDLSHSRSNTVRPSTHHYNPRDDGFTDLDVNDANVPFIIKFNTEISPDHHHNHHEDSRNAPYDRPHRKSANNLPLALNNPGTMTNSHSRSSSSASNNWEYLETEGLLTPLSAHRPQTVQAGQKAPRLLGLFPSTATAYSNSAAPTARSKSAGEGIKSPSVPLRREGNNYLISQQPHAPLPSTLASGASHSRGLAPGGHKSSEYTAGPPVNRSYNSGWTDADPVRTNPRTLVSVPWYCFLQDIYMLMWSLGSYFVVHAGRCLHAYGHFVPVV